MSTVVNLRLVTWVSDVDFRKSERTNWKLLANHSDRPRAHISRSDDAILLISKTRKMGAFIWGYHSGNKQLFAVVRFWCPNGFEWRMLQNYAREAGIELRGMKSFEDYFVRRVASHILQ